MIYLIMSSSFEANLIIHLQIYKKLQNKKLIMKQV